jgi:small subunit ribosomal protein S18
MGGGRGPKKLQLGLKADDPIDYKDLELLQKCVGAQGQILSRRRTGLTAKQQRKLKESIKRARHLALLSFVG